MYYLLPCALADPEMPAPLLGPAAHPLQKPGQREWPASSQAPFRRRARGGALSAALPDRRRGPALGDCADGGWGRPWRPAHRLPIAAVIVPKRRAAPLRGSATIGAAPRLPLMLAGIVSPGSLALLAAARHYSNSASPLSP